MLPFSLRVATWPPGYFERLKNIVGAGGLHPKTVIMTGGTFCQLCAGAAYTANNYEPRPALIPR